MKKITLLLLLFVSTAFYAQSTGISYQAIIYNPNGEVIPGYNNMNSPLANKNICLQFTIIDSASLTEYQEKITITTDEYGMVNTVIGTGIQTGGYATSFANVNWSLPSKRLKVGLDTFALCTNFIEISNQLFTSVPYAFAANSAENVTGVVPILHGGTSATTVLGAKTNLGLENVDNTRDINKPISIATQAALNLKEDLANKSTNVAADGTSNTKYPSVKAIKDYVDAGINAGGAGLANEAVIRANADLLKEDLVNKSTNVVTDGASNTKYPSVKAIKTYVDAADANLTTNLNAETAARIAGDNSLTTNLAAEIARATALDNTLTSNLSQELTRATTVENALTTNLAAEVTRATAAEATKENTANKSTATALGTSDVLFPTQKAVKTYVDAGVATATAAVTNEASVRAAADATLTTNLATEVTRATTAEATKENTANKSTATALGTSDVLFPTQNAVKTYVDTQVASATIADADATTKGKIQLNGDLTGTAAVPVIANNAIITAKIADASVTDPKIVGVSGSKVIGNISGSAANVTGIVPVANGGTGSATQNFVDLTTAQTVAGAKTFSSDLVVNGIKIGKGGGNQSTVIGDSANASQQNNTALGFMTLNGNSGTDNTAVGTNSLRNSAGSSYNTAVGESSGAGSNTGSNNTFLGYNAKVPVGSAISNSTVIGSGAIVTASNTIQLGADGSNGTTAISNVKTTGTLTTGSVTYPNTHNSTAGQVLTTDASGVASWSTPSTTATAYSGTLPIANGGTGSATQNFVDLTTSQTVAGAKTFSANVTAPSVTSPIYVSTPQALTSGASITWNPSSGSNASVTLNQNSTLSFSSTPAAGTYGTLVVTQDATGGRTLTLPSTTNVILGSTSTTTIGLSTAAGAKDILNFYYDGTNCYWNIGQGYGVAATPATTNLASGVTGTLPVANGGTGATTLSGIIKGNGTSALTAAVAGTDYQAPLTLTTTGTGAATLTGTTLNIPAVSSTVNANTITGTVAIANGGTGLSSTPANGQIDIGNGTGFTRATLTAGTAITITNTAGAITIAAAVRPTTDQAAATAGQTSFTLSQTPLNGKVWMFINGVRTNNNAYSISGTTLTYTPANNNSYTLVVGDRIQFDYAY